MGSVAKRPNGRWRARHRGADGKEHARHFDRKADAQQWLAQQVTRVADGTWVDPQAGRRTFGEYAAQWQAAQLHHRDSTRRITRYRLETHLLPYFGDRPLTSITRNDVQTWVRTLTVAPASVRSLYRLLAQVMLAAVEDRMLTASPCRKVNLPTVETGLVVPTVEEVAAVVDAASAVGAVMVLTAAGTGLRRNELLGLTVDRVDFLRRVIKVDRQLVSQGVLGPPKTAASVREIPVPETLTDLLAAHLAQRPSDDGWLFRTSSGLWWPQAFGTEWARWRTKAGVGFRFHDLRHFYASSLIAAGQSVKVVQERLGHSSARTTLDTYAHLWPADEDATREAVGGVLDDVSRTVRGLQARKSRSEARG